MAVRQERWHGGVKTLIPEGQRLLPSGSPTAETIIAMAAEWREFGGSFNVIRRSPRSQTVLVEDDFYRRHLERPDVGPHREPPMANLLARVGLHAASRWIASSKSHTAVSTNTGEEWWSVEAIRSDAAVLSLAILDVQLTGDPRIALWYLATTNCPSRCFYHGKPAEDGKWKWIKRDVEIADPPWDSLPTPAWRPGKGAEGRLDPSLPDAEPHPFFSVR